MPVPLHTVEWALECIESTLLVKLELLCQSLKMGQWNEVNPNAKASLVPNNWFKPIWHYMEGHMFHIGPEFNRHKYPIV